MRTRTRVAIAAVLAVACAAALAVWVSTHRGTRDERQLGKGPFATPAGAADQVPRTITELPEGCGLGTADLDALVPGNTKRSGCQWYGGSTRENRYLEIGDSQFPGSDFPEFRTTQDLSKYGDDPPRVVTGIGDSALAYADRDLGGYRARIALVIRDAAFLVSYTVSGKQVVPDSAMKGALRAASAFARKVKAPAAPKLGAPVRGRLVPAQAPKTCDAVSAKTLGRAVGRPLTPKAGAGEQIPGVPELVNAGCLWKVETKRGMRLLGVTINTSPEREPGSGEATAAHAIRALHRGNRGDPNPLNFMPKTYKPSNFQPIAGLGDHAFSAYLAEIHEVRVFFQTGNSVVLVQYQGNDREDKSGTDLDLPMKTQLNGAYTVAKDVAESL